MNQVIVNHRLRRLRHHPKIRQLMRETTLTPHDFIYPLFIHHGKNIKNEISSMPGQFQLSIDQLQEEITTITHADIPAVLLFGIPEKKDEIGSSAYDQNGIIQQAIQTIKDINPELLVITDLCCCEYTDHAHCGVLKNNDVDNDETLALLAKQAISHAKAGSDMIAPSGMMDGAVATIREALDSENFYQIPILSYAIKYSSALYGPFREAGNSAPTFGDRKTHQMDPANANEALREAEIDIAEGADMIMVKPALAYLDVITKTKQHFPEIPLAAYQVSGEYAMIKAAAKNGWLDETKVALETLTAIKRAGADMIISYFAKDIAAII